MKSRLKQQSRILVQSDSQRRDTSKYTARLVLRSFLQPELGRCRLPQWPSKLVLWILFQPSIGCGASKPDEELGVGFGFQPVSGSRVPAPSGRTDLWEPLQPELEDAQPKMWPWNFQDVSQKGRQFGMSEVLPVFSSTHKQNSQRWCKFELMNLAFSLHFLMGRGCWTQAGQASLHFAELDLWSKFHCLHGRWEKQISFCMAQTLSMNQIESLAKAKKTTWWVIWIIHLRFSTHGRFLEHNLPGVNLQTLAALRSLKLIQTFNQSLDAVELPQLEALSFGTSFNQDIDLIRFPKLRSLSFGDASTAWSGSFFFFNVFTLPQILGCTKWGNTRFNQRLTTLPENLERLNFGNAFNQSLEGVQFPRSLQSLTFGVAFRQRMNEIDLPESLQSLTLGALFQGNLPSLPKNLRHLNLKSRSYGTLHTALAHTTLEHLSLGGAQASLVDLPGEDIGSGVCC